jgi:hypothetical protein
MSCPDFRLACIIAQLQRLLRYAHGVSPAELSRNARWGNDDVVAERWG